MPNAPRAERGIFNNPPTPRATLLPISPRKPCSPGASGAGWGADGGVAAKGAGAGCLPGAKAGIGVISGCFGAGAKGTGLGWAASVGTC